MTILQKLDEEIKQAMKSKDAAKLEVVRLIKASVKNKEIELIHPLSEAEFFGVLGTISKKHKESIDQFQKAGRADLVEQEQKQLAIVETFLPKPLSQADLTALIEKTIEETKASGPKDMGVVVKTVREKAAGQVDGKMLADQVKERLSKMG